MKNIVNIITSDRGWILEKLAKELVARLPYARYGEFPDGNALINYYITYSAWKEKVSPVEVAYFAHLEQDERTKELFFTVARNVRHCVCHADIYSDILKKNGIKNVTTINPGVDLNIFTPKLNIGVVGRTYHTGRKGEALVARLMDIDYIEWHFTGDGWPGPALHVPAAELPDFYRKMDYILVPSLYEGGPMCVAEALACGTEVVAPPVGWVPQFPHIEYKTGDAEDLRRVLSELYQKKLKLRASVENTTWDAWAEGHDRLFTNLAREAGKTLVQGLPPESPAPSAAIVLHGSESTDKGGPSVRAPRTAELLRASGAYDARLCHANAFFPEKYDLVHIFNLFRLDTARQCVDAAFFHQKRIVLSTIFLDLSEIKYFKGIQKIFSQYYDDADLDWRLASFRARREDEIARGGRYLEMFPGHFDAIRDIVSRTDHVVFLSEHERKLFEAVNIPVNEYSIVHNPVDAEKYASATPDLFAETYGVKDYILCVGRLEARKNQLMLARALRDVDMPIVFVGHGVDKEYESLLRRHAPEQTVFTGRLEAGSPMLASAYAGARVCCLPSWAEGASLAALEAAASGCRLVLSNRSSEREYFSDYAAYCDPFSLESIRKAVLAACDDVRSPRERKEQQRYVQERYSWDKYIEKTRAVYDAVMKKDRKKKADVILSSERIYIDMTSSANRSGPPSGIARVEYLYAKKLYELYPGKVRLVLWNGEYRTFVPVSYEQVMDDSFKMLRGAEYFGTPLNTASARPFDNVDFARGSVFIILGGAWITNTAYSDDVRATATACELKLIYFIHDIIHAKFPHRYPDGVGRRFAANCKKVLGHASFILANSRCTAADIQEFAGREGIPCPPVAAVRFGDDISEMAREGGLDLQPILDLIGRDPFILCVSAIDVRKNHVLLYNVWRRMIAERGLEKTPHLICVGSKGWSIDVFIDMLKRDEVVSKKIHILHNIEDIQLDWLYRRCLFTVYPSLYEGWGLPVAESLAYGKVCVAADAASIPEICPQYTDLIDPYDFRAWYERLSQYIFNRELLEQRTREVKNYKPCTWEESSRQMIAILGERCAAERLPPFCAYDTDYSHTSAEVETMLCGGWGQPETGGVWSLGARSSLCFRLWMEGRPAIMSVSCRNDLPEEKGRLEIDVFVNGRRMQFLSMTKGQGVWRILLPARPDGGQAGEFATFHVDFAVRNPYRPCDIKESTDTRILGFHLSGIRMTACSDDDASFLNIVNLIEKIDPACAASLLSILFTRKDIVKRCLSQKFPLESLFLWAWRYGVYEVEELASLRERLSQIFSRLHSLPYNGAGGEYTQLLHCIWRAREDLHAFSPETDEGRAMICEWYRAHGMRECELQDFPAASSPRTAAQ